MERPSLCSLSVVGASVLVLIGCHGKSDREKESPQMVRSALVVPGGFSATGSMSTSRADATHFALVVLADHRVLVCGGFDGAQRLRSAEIFDPATGVWTATGSMNETRIGHNATLLADGRVLVAGGDPAVATAELYDPTSGRWSSTGSLSQGRKTFLSIRLQSGRVLAAGGSVGSPGEGIASTEIYDPISGAWSAAGGMVRPRTEHAAVVLGDGRVLVAGGRSSGTPSASAEIFDPTSGAWSEVASMLTARPDAFTLTLLQDGRALAVGGSSGAPLAAAEIFDPGTATWSATAALPTARAFHAAQLLADGSVLVAGGVFGTNNASALASAVLFDPSSSAWIATSSAMTVPRYIHGSAPLPAGRVLLVGGVTVGGAALASAEIYQGASPVVESVSPSSGPPGSNVAINGFGFGGFVSPANNQVTIGGVRAPIKSWGGTQIVVSIPFGAISGAVAVRNGASTTTGPALTVTQPTVTGLSVGAGPVGMTLRVGWQGGLERLGRGSPDPEIGDFTILFGGTPTSALSSNYDVASASAQVPYNATTGPVSVRWGAGEVAADGTVTRRVLEVTGPVFTITQPTITSILPHHGTVGTRVLVGWQGGLETLSRGTGGPLAAGQFMVLFSGQPASTLYSDYGPLGAPAQVPSGAVTGPVTVRWAAVEVSPDGTTGAPRTIEITGPTFFVGDFSPPVADAGSDQSANASSSVRLDGSLSTDPNGLPLTYRWSQIAGTAVALDVADPVHPVFTAPPVLAGSQTLTFQLVVSDGVFDSAVDTVNVTVKHVNHAPIVVAGTNQTVGEGSTVTLDGAGSYDPDGDAITYRWTQTMGPVVTLSNGSAAQPTFMAPAVSSGSVTIGFALTVDDGSLTSTGSVAVTVEHVNHRPLANAGDNQTVNEGTTVTLDGTRSSDPDGDPLEYTWSQVSGPAVPLGHPSSANPTFAAPSVSAAGATLVFELSVTDPGGLSARSTVRVTVIHLNPVCSAAAASPSMLWPPNHKLLPVDIKGVTDPDGSPVTIRVTSVTQDEPINGLGDGDTSPDAVLQEGHLLLRGERAGLGNGRVYWVQFSVDDGRGGTCTGSVTVGVPSSRSGPPATDDGQRYNSLTP